MRIKSGYSFVNGDYVFTTVAKEVKVPIILYSVASRTGCNVEPATVATLFKTVENIVGIKNPKVAIVNIGAEEEKGNALVKETFPLLKSEDK